MQLRIVDTLISLHYIASAVVPHTQHAAVAATHLPPGGSTVHCVSDNWQLVNRGEIGLGITRYDCTLVRIRVSVAILAQIFG